tara:strand:+ start:522 stop:1727 length:1206 start_codon:yes stop_codon:yes gene_type:complete
MSYPKINKLDGILISTISTGIKKGNKKDLVIINIDKNANTVGAFTNSETKSEAVKWSKYNIKNNIKAIVVNSGNANALTGKEGYNSIKMYTTFLSKKINCKTSNILVASTGIIGEQLDYKKINKAIPKLLKKSKIKCCSWKSFSESIMTTDTFPKAATKRLKIGNKVVTISGVAKGSGMIYPNMGTMLGFIFTDAKIPKQILRKTLLNGIQKSFNSITVDGDTSTSDTVFLTATGKVNNKQITSLKNKHYLEFIKKFNELLLDLALQIVKDGEGAKKLIKIKVNNSKNYLIAKKVAFSIANSLLVKTFLGSKELNFGRIFMAIGKSLQLIKQDKISFSLGNFSIAKEGKLLKRINANKIKRYMNKKELLLEINLNTGKESATVYTCDLTQEYIKINTNYIS